MEEKQTKSLGKRIGTGIIVVCAVLFALFFFYTEHYYHADAQARTALQSGDGVTVSQAALGYLFDGPGTEDLLIFYPGAKVEEIAYAPLLHRIAAEGMDVCLVEMPFRLAVLAPNRADRVMETEEYANWYIGGHSLGGAVAANYASDHGEKLRGLVLLASYATHPLDPGLQVLLVEGSEDGVVNRAKLEAGMQYLPADAVFYTIPGGNHAQFGSYGPQRGDGEARIAPEEQWAETAAVLARLPDRAA